MSKIFVTTHHTVLVRQQDTIAKDTHRREGMHMNSTEFITRLDFITTACTSPTSFLVYASLLASSLFTSMYQHAHDAFMTSQTHGIFMYLEHFDTENVPRRKQIAFFVTSCSM